MFLIILGTGGADVPHKRAAADLDGERGPAFLDGHVLELDGHKISVA
jgi:hypothetical protein